VVCDPDDYNAVLAALAAEKSDPAQLAALRRKLALKVFQRTASYDAAIARYLELQAAEPDLEALSGFPRSSRFPGRRRSRSATARTRTKKRRSTARSTTTSRSSRARNSVL
jgi:AICAR transformylase/IMP cyclohydrolase PurH